MNNIKEIFEGFKNLKVLVIGDLMVDSYSFGKVTRISPEAPVPVLNLTKRENRLGGAGNVVKNILSLGAKPIVCSVIGNDSSGKIILDLLKEDNLSTNMVIQEENRITTSKERVISGSQQIVRIDDETDSMISNSSMNLLIEKISNIIAEVDVIIFEDYDKGVLNEELIQKIISLAKEKNIATVVDPKKRNFLSYSGVDLFKPNLKELLDGLNISNSKIELEDLKTLTEDFRKKFQMKNIFLTMSEKGVLLNNEGRFIQYNAHTRTIADVSGAGDTVISVAACCLGLNLSADLIAALSNLAGGLVCEYVGVVPVKKEQLISEADQIFN